MGTYTDKPELGSKGLYTLSFETETGYLEKVGEGPFIDSPSFLTVNKAGDRLYAANELDVEGYVTSLKISEDNSKLEVVS